MIQHHVQWVTASPLWHDAADDPARMQRPSLLRFASDQFMDELHGLLDAEPRRLAEHVARPESFRARPVGAPRTWRPTATQLKLYQPSHGHFYLVAANLVCRQTGLPDKTIDPSFEERAGFVLRRLGAGGEEMAWVTGPDGKRQWLSLSAAGAEALAPAEDVLPMFPLAFCQEHRRRRMLVGFIPTSSRETFQAAPGVGMSPPADDPALATETDPRFVQAQNGVILRLAELHEPPTPPTDHPTPEEQAQREAARERIEQEASQFIVLDLADVVSTHLPTLWQAFQSGTPPSAGTTGSTLYHLLDGATTDTRGGPTWRAAMTTSLAEFAVITGEVPGTPSQHYNLRHTDLDPAALRAAVLDALGPHQPPVAPPTGLSVPKLDPTGDTRYRLRCVYQRPTCGPLQPDLLSRPTEPFAIAPFFDFDAPTRPIRISLPIDTSIAGLRKFDKNVAFLISAQLREQMEKATDLKKALDGNLASGQSFDLGVICSFSLPIITICALMILLIFIVLLNIVFWWVPFFRLCLPLGLKVK